MATLNFYLDTADKNGRSLGYDYLNRTDKITVTTSTNRYIYYTYNASGQLIRKQAYDNAVLQTTTDYIDGFVYITQSGTTALSYFPMPEGRVVNTGSGGTVTLTQEFVIADQQGNARVSFRNNGSGAAVVYQENSYYAFGLIMPNSPVATPTVPNKQLYNGGSEWQNDYSNLPDYYQTYYRNYDAAIARWVGVDPMADYTDNKSCYSYAGNNPVMYNDPLGNLLNPAKMSHPITSSSQIIAMPIAGPGGDGTGGANSDFLDDGFGGGDPSLDGGSYYGNTSAIDGGDYSSYYSGSSSLIHDVLAGINNTNVSSVTFSMNDFITASNAENDVRPGQTTDLVLRSNGLMGIETFPATASTDNSNIPMEYTSLMGSSFQRQSFPNLGTLWKNYPHTTFDKNGNPIYAHPITDNPDYTEQCAIRMGLCLIRSGVSLSSYKGVMDEGYPLRSGELANWFKGILGDPIIMSYDDFLDKYGSRAGGIIYETPYQGGLGHIDLVANGQAGSGFWATSTIWYWPISTK